MGLETLSINKSETVGLFKGRADPKESVVTLGGTGPNGSIHTLYLQALGYDYVRNLSQINVLSASSFAFYIFIAKELGCLKLKNYERYDTWVRNKHKKSLAKIIGHFKSLRLPDSALYTQGHLRETIEYLFEESFLEMTLSDFDHNAHFWVYCSKTNKNLSISKLSYPSMKVWEAISAASSIPFIHGEFDYGQGSFRDGVFSPIFKSLHQTLQKTSKNHLYLNYKRNAERNNLLLVSNTDSRTPIFELASDYFMFICNIPNRRVNRTHQLVLG